MQTTPATPAHWIKTETETFWGEISPHHHVLQVYNDDTILLETLLEFIEDGIRSGDSCIIIATSPHLQKLYRKLIDNGHDVFGLVSAYRYIPLVAEKTLLSFMRDGWPDESLFRQAVTKMLRKAQGPGNRKVRAYGEMVALLWERGNKAATVQLEHLWNRLVAQEKFCLFCAYPQSFFNTGIADTVKNICCAHSRVIHGGERSGNVNGNGNAGKNKNGILYCDTAVIT